MFLFPLLFLIAPFAVVGALIYFGVRFLRAYERRSVKPSDRDSLGASARIDALETQIERMSTEIERMAESQQFMKQLLEQRPARLPPVVPPTPPANDQ